MSYSFKRLRVLNSSATERYQPQFFMLTLSTYRYWAVNQLLFRLCMCDGFKQASGRDSGLQNTKHCSICQDRLSRIGSAQVLSAVYSFLILFINTVFTV
jgi:hypothetical protein